ncbi:hypothetical protein FA15DRAFT_402257 [Coprinopsis marcescibilis]|uniref:Glycosyltransferase family 32 protein n=1 Tax=Coprinopsis marcescibilis TaxID=230819 RepID=A0A5C3L9G2_COPMA|nr:hypothetical protein FA15DRAFT_402257 [Coprinopsis marcescibilis]
MNTRRVVYVFLSILALFLLGTVLVLSSVTYYLAIHPAAYLSDLDLTPPFPNATVHERIPRIIHQTWKYSTLPARWQPISNACREMMPDYEYRLWTDESSRTFIAEHYPWFLDIYDGYKFPIQRADVIRYFVLHHYGGIYMDLDIGCLRPIDPLLVYPVVLPKTIPVGVSNDLILAEKGHPFMQQTIHNLVTFDHSWLLNYPTVMFSTGPMFLSAQYGIYTTSRHNSANSQIRILPKSLYGKNAKPEEAPNSFFSHFYGSSWHADDAAFVTFLGSWGKTLMWIGLTILIIGLIRLSFSKQGQRRGLRRIGGYDIHFPRISRSGRWYLSLTRLSSSSSSPSSVSPSTSDESVSPIDSEVLPLLHLPFNTPPGSPSQRFSDEPFAGRLQSSPSISDLFRRVRSRISLAGGPASGPSREVPMTPIRSRRHRYSSRGVLFFLPAIFTTTHSRSSEEHETGTRSTTPPPAYCASGPVAVSDEKRRDLEFGNPDPSLIGESSSSRPVLQISTKKGES